MAKQSLMMLELYGGSQSNRTRILTMAINDAL